MGQVSLNKIQQVKVSDIVDGQQLEKVLTVQKMPLGRHAEFFREIGKVPKTLSSLAKLFFGDSRKPATKEDFAEAAEERGDEISDSEDLSTEDIIDALVVLPDILADNWEDLIKAFSLLSGVAVEDLEPLDLDEATAVIVAAVEVNNFFGIGDRYRELLARKRLAQTQMTAPRKRK